MKTLDAQAQADARHALALSEAISRTVLAVIERAQQQTGPAFNRYISLHALAETLGALMVEAVEHDPERATPWIRETLARLSVHVEGPRGERLH